MAYLGDMASIGKVVVMVFASLFGLACSVVGIRTVKEPRFRVTLAEADKQIRDYDPYLVARTRIDGDYDASGSEGFRRLFDYISGNNSAEEKISMTAPVLQEQEGKTIAMTAPVLQQRDGQSWCVDFVMPADLTLSTVPVPRDQRVVIVEVPRQTVAVIRYSGLVSSDDIDEKARELKEWLRARNYRIISEPRSARYDPPFTLPPLRRNEVHVTVEPMREMDPTKT